MLDIHDLFQGILSLIRRNREDSLLASPGPIQSFSPRKYSEHPARIRAACLAILMSVALFCAPATAQAPNVFSGSTATGQSSQPLAVLVTITAGGVAAAPQALTQGVANGEFTIAAGGTCTAGVSYNAGDTCTVSVVFHPKYPGPRSGAVVIKTSGGSFMGVALLAGLATGPLPVLTEGVIDTVAGDASWIYEGDGVLATAAPIFLPTGLAVDAAGNLYLSDSGNNRVRRVDAETGLISTVAGTGAPGYNGDGGPATQAMVSTPAGLLLDGAGNLYIADTGNHIIRRVDAFSGKITTVAGTPGTQGYSGDGNVATRARLSLPEGMTFDAAGDLLIADTGNNVVREVNAATGNISTIAGTGTAGFNGDGRTATTALLNSPWSVAVAQNGSFYIADLANNRVRLVNSSGVISSVAGTGIQGFSGDGGNASTALLDEPAAVVLDPAGDLYIADSGNNRVREVNASTGLIATITGTDSEQFAGDDGPANLASLYGPYALFFDESGNLFIADMFHNRVREIDALTVSLQYAAIKVGNVSPSQAFLLANDGNANMDITAPGLVNAATDPATTTCTIGADILSASTCNVGADFAPTVIGDPVLGSITINSNAASTAPVIKLSGEVLSITPTTIAVTSSVNPSLVGAAVTFTATVSNGGAALTGTVVFLDGTTQLCSVSVSNSSATCITSGLTLGQHNITASYSGDSNDASSVSPVLVQVVKQSPVLTLTVAPNPAIVTSNVTLTLTATAPTGTPTGAVTFYDGTTALIAVNLSASGVATYSTTQLSVGPHSLSVQYAGDTSNASGQSNVVSEVIQQATTGTTLSSSNITAPVGSQVTFTAVVTSTNGPEPTGTVQFNDGSTSLGSSMVGSNGTAVLSLTSLAPGTHSIVAVYSGDTDNLTSTSAPLIETIQQIATATALSPSLNPISAGATLNLAAAVTATGAPAGAVAITGNVTFSEGSTIYGSVALNGSGDATFSLSTLSAGSHSIIASYSGNTNYASSTSAILVEVVQSTATTTTLTSTAPTTLAGETASFTAAVSSSTGIPTGSVTFYDGAVALGQAQLNAQGVALFSTTTLAVGTHTLTAVYAGNGNYNTSTSAPLQHAVVLATTSLTLAGPGAPVNAGTPFAMTATLSSNGVAPTGALTLRNGAATIATQSVAADGTFSFSNIALGVGTYQLTAVYGGDANNATVTSSAVTVIVQLTPTTTSLISSANPATLGQSVTFTATASGGTPIPTGSIKFMDGATVLGSSPVGASGAATLSTSTLAFGAHSITASYQGDTDHAVSSSATLNEQIVEAATASLSSSANPSIFGTNVVFTIKITGVGSIIPTGTVIFKDGASALGTATLDGTGTTSWQTALLAVGSHPITASYSGDTNYSVASAALIQTVQSATTRITLASSANPAIYATPATFTATVTGNGGVATGSISFTDGGASIGSALLNANGVAVLTTSALAPGTHTIVANYAGDSNIGASSSTPLTFSVKQLTSVALASNANPAMTLSPIVLTATVTNSGIGQPTGTVTFTDGSTQLGMATLNASGVASLTVPSLTVGNHSLSASYAGDGANFTSVSSNLTESIQLRPTTVAITSSDTNPTNPLQITLISAVDWTGSATLTGTITFTDGTTVLGSSQVDSIGVATLTISLQSTTESIVATYSGDISYAGSSSQATSVTGGISTQFVLQINPTSVTMQTQQHGTISVSALSLQGFSDTLQLGCLGLPYAATCTFSTPQMNLAANGTATAQLVIDTGNPLGAGSTARLDRRQTSGVLLCFLPCLLGIGFGARRKKFKASTLLLLVCMVTMTLSAMGCAGLHMNGTPPGTYTFKVTASGENSGATLSQTVTLTVTQ
jgi:sugar lactone lactonase YvrE